MDSKYAYAIYKYIQNKLRRSLSKQETETLIKHVLRSKKSTDLFSTAEKLFTNNSRFDIKAYLDEEIKSHVVEPTLPMDLISASDLDNGKNQIITNDPNIPKYTIENVLGTNDLIDRFKLSDYRTKTYKVLLDRRYRINPLSNDAKISWNITDTYANSTDDVQVSRSIKNIISVKIGDFYLNNSLYTDNVTFNVFPVRFLTVLIEELSSQSFISNANRNFHFWGSVVDPAWVSPPTYLVRFSNKNSPAGNVINGSSTNKFPTRRYDGNNGAYYFNTPITRLNTITISIGNIYNLIQLPQDYFTFTYLNSITRTFSINGDANLLPNLQTRIYISGFNTNNPVADMTLISVLNNKHGLTAYYDGTNYVINNTDDEGVPITLPVQVGVQISTAYVYLNFNRFFIPLEFECIE